MITKPAVLEEHPDFSLVLGGPLFQLWRRAHLSGDALELAHRRVVVIALLAWLPLLLLSIFGGHSMGGTIKVPFLYDIEAHVRFLIALPLLVAAELIVHRRIRRAVEQFVRHQIVVPEDMPRFRAAINSATRARNSVVVEIVLLVLVYTLGIWLWRSQIAAGSASWYALQSGGSLQLTLAGYWYALVSIPIFQFILLRWYFRFFLWFQFLRRVSRLNLHLVPTHPDRAAGLGFLGNSTYAFASILFAQGALLAGLIANRILYEGQSLMTFKIEVAGFLVFFVVIVLSPLVMFSMQLAQTKRQGLREYGQLASRYVQRFEEKWVRGKSAGEDELLGSSDIQSLADLGNSFKVVEETRLVPFGWMDILRLVVVAAAPLLPLMLTVFSLAELLTGLIKILF